MSDTHMSPERLVQIQELYHSALELEPAKRAAFLAAACADDSDLLHEVSSLLAQDNSTGPMERPLIQAAAGLLGDSSKKPIAPGTELGPYRILSRIGEGGMGCVYKASDTRLDRIVAIKTVNEEFSSRFQREARAISAMNHPHICTLYDVGPDYLVMELLEGETLAARLSKGKLSIEETARRGSQIAAALAAAHAKGIVHRDLKPSNVMLTKAGVKILDFGVAKSTHEVTLTESRVAVGTPAYMAPEQREGKSCDARTDIYALGLLLREMATGSRDGSCAALSPNLAHVIDGCLQSDPDERWQSSSDVAKELVWAADAKQADTAAPSNRKFGILALVTTGVAILALAGVSWLHFHEAPSPPAIPLRFQIAPPEGHTAGALLNMSPDGQKVAFIADGRLWVHFLESGESRDLTAAGGTPFWSPDSRFVGYGGYGPSGGLWRIEATGGVPRKLASYKGPWGAGTWNQNDVIVYSNQSEIFRVPAAGGLPLQIAANDGTQSAFPSFLPDGVHFLYTQRFFDDRKSAVRIGSIDSAPEAQNKAALINSTWGASYAPSTDPAVGHLLFVRDSTLMAQPMNPRTLAVTGPAVPVAEHIEDGRAYSVSSNGVLVFQQRSLGTQLKWIDRQGKYSNNFGDPENFITADISPDGTRVLLMTKPFGQASGMWLMDLKNGLRTRIGLSSANESDPIWMPAGDRIIFSSNRGGEHMDLYRQTLNGAEGAELLLRSDENKFPTSCSPDGRFLLYSSSPHEFVSHIWLLPLVGSHKPIPFLQTEAYETGGRFSPDGHWVSYYSDESGRYKTYVRSFTVKPDATGVELGEKHLVGGSRGRNRWRRDGRELFYVRSGDGMLMAVEIATHSGFHAGPPEPLFRSKTSPYPMWDVAPDGKSFLVGQQPEVTPPYNVILNWQATLKR